ncbi:hypothetical protein [Streptomyces yerevanensis]|uniref:hypothetical protein n=1 Tax=Streptomyces yerevanensis TaxID=66378 RepID=UPI0005263BA4
MRTTPLGVFVALALTPLLAGCFVSGEQGTGAGPEGGPGGRLRGALAVPPAQALSPYSNDATVLSKLSVAEGLTALDYEVNGGVVDSEITSIDMNTGAIKQGPVLTKAGESLGFREPEGLDIYQTADGEARLFLGFASGSSVDRRSNLFYKNALV